MDENGQNKTQVEPKEIGQSVIDDFVSDPNNLKMILDDILKFNLHKIDNTIYYITLLYVVSDFEKYLANKFGINEEEINTKVLRAHGIKYDRSKFDDAVIDKLKSQNLVIDGKYGYEFTDKAKEILKQNDDRTQDKKDEQEQTDESIAPSEPNNTKITQEMIDHFITETDIINETAKNFDGKKFNKEDVHTFLYTTAEFDDFLKTNYNIDTGIDSDHDALEQVAESLISKMKEEKIIKYNQKDDNYSILKRKKEKEQDIDTSDVSDTRNLDLPDSEDDLIKRFKNIINNIDDVQNKIEPILEEFSKKSSIVLEGKNLNEQIHNLFNKLDNDKKEEFANKINPVLKKLKMVKEEGAKLYQEALEKGNKDLKETREKIENTEKEIQEILNDMDEAKKIELRASENASELSSYEHQKANLEEKISLGTATAEDKEKIKEIDARLSELRGEATNIGLRLSSIYDKYNVRSYSEIESKINQKNTELTDLKQKYENGEKEFLDVADTVRTLLFEKGIKIDIEGRSEIPFDDIEENSYTQNQAPAPSQQQASNYEQANSGNKQQASSAQQANNSNQQTSGQPQNNLPSTNIDSKLQLDRNISVIINSGDIWENMIDHRNYDEFMNNFDVISNNRASLTKVQKKQLKDAFAKSAAKACLDIKEIDQRTLDAIKSVVGKENFELIKDELSGKGTFLKDSSNGFKGLSTEVKNAMAESAEKCYSMLKNGEISDDDFELINEGLLKPLRFASTEKACTDLIGNRFFNFFKNRKDNKVFGKISNTLYGITKELEKKGYYEKATSLSDSREEKEMPTKQKSTLSFKEALGQCVNKGKDLKLYVEQESIEPVKQINKGKEKGAR